VFTVYYVGLIVGEELGDRLVLTPFFAMWTPNVIFATVGLIGLWRIRKPATRHTAETGATSSTWSRV